MDAALHWYYGWCSLDTQTENQQYDCFQYDEDILTTVQDSDDSGNTFDYKADSEDILQVEEGEGRGCTQKPFTWERENRSKTLFWYTKKV